MVFSRFVLLLLLKAIFFSLPWQSRLMAREVVPHFSHITLKDGLSHSKIYVIYQDSRGLMWFGSENGLNRFDGLRIKIYSHKPNDDNSLSADNISALLEDSSGYLWVGTWGGGLNRLNPQTGNCDRVFIDVGNGINVSRIPAIFEDEDKNLWVGSNGWGLFRKDASGKFKQYTPVNSRLKGSVISAITGTRFGLVWVATDRGLCYYDPAQDDFISIDASFRNTDLSTSPIYDMILDRSRKIWTITDSGLGSLDPETGAYTHRYPTENTESDQVIGLYEDSEGGVWWGTVFNGLWTFDGEKTRQFLFEPDNPLSINSNHIRSIYEDKSGNLWVGTDSDGVNRLSLDSSNFRHYYFSEVRKNRFPDGEITSMATSEGVFWIGSSSSGLTRWDRDRNQFQHFKHDPNNPASLSNNGVTSLAFNAGKLWVGAHGGLNLLEDNQFTRFGQKDGLLEDLVLSLMGDRDGVLWIGSLKGLTRYDGSFKNDIHDPARKDGIGIGPVRCIYEDRTGIVWLGLEGGGLNRYDSDTGKFKIYKPDDSGQSISDSAILSIHEYQGALWVGSMSRGLNRLDLRTGTIETFDMTDGLPNNVIKAIQGDRSGSLWVSTNRGLSRFDISDREFFNYDFLDGLQSNQFSAGSSLRLASGEMLFGGINGVSSFLPARIRISKYVPPLVISGFKVNGQDWREPPIEGMTIELKPDENFIEFEFASLDYSRPQKNRYKFKLDGVDNQWREIKHQAFAAYTDLAPGNYTFRVEGANRDGIWTGKEVFMDVNIKPPPYLTWWAYTIYTLISLTFIYMIIAFQKRQERIRSEVRLLAESERLAVEANRAKSAFLAHMSHELRTPLNVIIGYAEMLEEEMSEAEKPEDFDPAGAAADMTRIRSAAQYQLALVSNLLELTKIESDDVELFHETFSLETLINEIVDQMTFAIEQDGNRLEIIHEDSAPKEITIDQTRLRGVLLNLLGNANKYTNSGEITFRIRSVTENGLSYVCFEVKDTGIGLSTGARNRIFKPFQTEGSQAEAAGLGLYLSRHFVELMEGRIEVDSKLHEGATFRVYLPDIDRSKN